MDKRGTFERAAGSGPQSCDGPENGAFSRAARPHDHEALIGAQFEGQLLHQRFFFSRSADGEFVEFHDPAVFLRYVYRLEGDPLFLRIMLVELVPQAAKTLNTCQIGTQSTELRDDQRERRQDRGKRAGRLGNDAEFHLPAHVHRCDHQHGKNEREVIIAVGEEPEVTVPGDDQAHVLHRDLQAVDQIQVLAFFPAVKRDRLRVIPDPDEAVAEISLLFVLMIVQPNQLTADQDAHDGSRERVYH